MLPAPDRFPAFAAELALLLGDLIGGSPHTPPLYLPPWDSDDVRSGSAGVLHHSFDECCGCCRGHCTLREKQLRPQVGATASKAAQKVLYNCTRAWIAIPLSIYVQIELLSSNYIKCIAYITAQSKAVIEEEEHRAVGGQ